PFATPLWFRRSGGEKGRAGWFRPRTTHRSCKRGTKSVARGPIERRVRSALQRSGAILNGAALQAPQATPVSAQGKVRLAGWPKRIYSQKRRFTSGKRSLSMRTIGRVNSWTRQGRMPAAGFLPAISDQAGPPAPLRPDRGRRTEIRAP